MGSKEIAAALLLLLVVIVDCMPLQAPASNKKSHYEKTVETTNICEIDKRVSYIHCYCEDSQDINKAKKTECWIFNGGIKKSDPLWSSFTSQLNLETLSFNVRVDGGLDFTPTNIFIHLRKLRYFSIKQSSIVKIESETFSNLISIEELILTQNKITVLCKYAFYNLSNLRIISLENNRVENLQVDTFYKLPSLEKLVLTSNSISFIEVSTFHHLRDLKDLELDRNNIIILKNKTFEGLDNLKRLNLRRNKIAVVESYTFMDLWNLKELLLDNNNIFELAVRAFDGLSQLNYLSLSRNTLKSLPDTMLQGVRGLFGLDLRHNKLKKISLTDIQPIYENLKKETGVLYLDGNALNCDCHLAWMYKLRQEAANIEMRISLDNFICNLPPEQVFISKLTCSDRKDANKTMNETEKIQYNSEDLEHEDDEADNDYNYEPKKILGSNERHLLQIPVDLLTCPVEIENLTEAPCISASENKTIDLNKSSSLPSVHKIVKLFLVIIMLLK